MAGDRDLISTRQRCVRVVCTYRLDIAILRLRTVATMDIDNELEDDILTMYMLELMEEEDEEDEAEEDEEWAIAGAAFVLGGAIAAREKRRAARRRLYLTRPDLLRNPRGNTPWQRMYEGRNDRAFITTMGFDVNTFDILLGRAGFAERWDSRPIPRPDVEAQGNPRLRRRSVDAAGALGLVLHWLNSTMREVSLQQIFALVPSTVNRYIHAAVDVLYDVLEVMPEAQIKWPSTVPECVEYAKIIQERHNLLEKAFGTVDGLNLPVQTSGNEDMENAMYNGWLHDHVVSNIFVFSPKVSLTHRITFRQARSFLLSSTRQAVITTLG
ncbi:hypothetical protein BC629DRAFT_1441703 [Irpex lacteus]|nr:hypothetical protein BC629DRAFT_1441703 [Irpex lacteus]